MLVAGCLKPSQELHIGSASESGSEVGKQVMIRAIPKKGNIRDERYGKEIWFAYGPVTGDSQPANGVATAHFLETGVYVLGMQINIAEPENGTFYEAWLVGISPQDRVSAGHLLVGSKKGREELRFESKTDLRKYAKLAITKEKDDGNPAPSEQVATGILKVTKR